MPLHLLNTPLSAHSHKLALRARVATHGAHRKLDGATTVCAPLSASLVSSRRRGRTTYTRALGTSQWSKRKILATTCSHGAGTRTHVRRRQTITHELTLSPLTDERKDC